VIASSSSLLQIEAPWSLSPTNVIVGKDVLELLSTSMYVDPMAIYREYVQNAADAIDEARRLGIITADAGRVTLSFEDSNRCVRIRDDGTGIGSDQFEARLTAFGFSKKRGSSARGFRGVGRLAGIGYCQELVFRSRISGEHRVSEMRWDCRKLRSLLRDPNFTADLADLVGQVVSSRRIQGHGWPEHFFEVELRGVIRHRDDKLMNPLAVQDYLSQNAPVPFCPTFKFGSQIASELGPLNAIGHVAVEVAGTTVYRPHRNSFAIRNNVSDSFTDVEFVRIPGRDGVISAFGWILHHGYKGAIPREVRIGGLRMRVGNIQIGDTSLLNELFAEPRFNAWSVGEVHILDPRVIPNGRRDHFEQSHQYLNILNYLSPVAREIGQRCRKSSIHRNWIRRFDGHKHAAQEVIKIIKQGSLSSKQQRRLASDAKETLAAMRQIANKETFRDQSKKLLIPTVNGLERNLAKATGSRKIAKSLSRLPVSERRTYEEVFSLIYECSPSHATAKNLIDRILSRIK